MQVLNKTMTSFFLFSTLLISNCTQPKSATSTFNRGSVDRATAGNVQQSDLKASLSTVDGQEKVNEILEGNLQDLVETNLKNVQNTIGNKDVEYNGNLFYGLEAQLSDTLEYMQDMGIGQDYKVRDILEEEGISVADFKKGNIPQDFLDSTMELSAEFLEKGVDTFTTGEIEESGEIGFALADCPPGMEPIRERTPTPKGRAPLCGSARKPGSADKLPAINCKAASRAEKVGTIAGGSCGAAAAMCAIGAIPTEGLACTGLVVCGAAGGAVSAGAAIAGLAGDC